MSYASQVKKELTELTVHRQNAKAELMALIRMNGSISIQNSQMVLNVQTESPALARRIYRLLKDFYQIESDIVVRRKMKLKKNNTYVVRLQSHVRELLSNLGILEGYQLAERVPLSTFKDDLMIQSYLRGAFLAGGSVNNPQTSRYHLEIYSLYESHNDMIKEMINHFGLNARSTARRSGFIVYLKEAEKIADFLQLIGATNSMLEFENIRIVRDMRNSVNRLVNCENANMDKVANAANRQVENIRLIDSRVGLSNLPEKLQAIAQTRLDHPEVSLKELGVLVPGGPISKSGVNHRLRKLNDYADKLRAPAE
ncbi:MAG TPA: DNA-binding protein WhiA [Candidatus Limosilactobacillus merdigallinarum]|uniref:Probable cell division protein WhiA n=1 Tax=Candidatus Limosilactobacillus merdigallinarum TaxID=2838652 RepID=A0A9D1VI64_9LACO|nr:DNA-binding protein WhiA [Candidatus Limosilactobacillus merdigallinarum]